MRIHLSALGWFDDGAEGNRLRWWFPASVDVGGGYLGLPQRLLIERAPLGEDERDSPKRGDAVPSAWTPWSWWTLHGTVTLSGGAPPLRHAIAPSQAVKFVYDGPPAVLVVRDGQKNRTVAVRHVQDGDIVLVEGARLDEIVVFAAHAELQFLATLDLTAARKLAFEPLAEVAVEPSIHAGHPEVAGRHPGGPPTLNAAHWKDLAQLLRAAQDSAPDSEQPGTATPWQAAELVLAMRWEHALLAGSAFLDGPDGGQSPLDEVLGDLLTSPTAVAYRLVDPAGRVEASNVVAVPGASVPPLTTPASPVLVTPTVRLTADESFDAAYGIRWQGDDPRAIGAELEEELTGSSVLGSPPEPSERFQHRSRRPEDPVRGGVLERRRVVAMYDVSLRARTRLVDAWDREGGWSGWSPWVTPEPRHAPAPPPLASARRSDSDVTVVRQLPTTPDDPAAWAPDALVRHAGATVGIYRRIAEPARADLTIGHPLPGPGGELRAEASTPAPSWPVLGATLRAGAATATVLDGNWPVLIVEIPAGAPSFAAGSAVLTQSPNDPGLWQQVAEFPIAGLPIEFAFTDPHPGPGERADVLSYCARVSWLGRLGPAGNTVQAIRMPAHPIIPPPFSATLLGADFYDRSWVVLELVSPAPGSRFTTYWADGHASDWAPGEDFADRAVQGEHGEQVPADGTRLFDVLGLPLAAGRARRITIGLQRVTSGGGRSDYLTLPITLPPAI